MRFLGKFYLLCGLFSPLAAQAACQVQYDLSDTQLHVPCIRVGNGVYQADFVLANRLSFLFELAAVAKVSPSDLTGASDYDILTSQLMLRDLTVSQNKQPMGRFAVVLQGMGNNQFGITQVTPLSAPSGNNQPPVASNLSLQADPALPYQEINLIATDANHDTLAYELVSASQGAGYDLAYINPLRPVLYVTLAAGFTGNIVLQYRVTDGQLFSASASVTLTVAAIDTDKGRGLEAIDAKEYATFNSSRFKSDLMGAPNDAPTLPRRIDLSGQFPKPANQGRQNSCVSWATAYAVKSYQEAVEVGWALNTSEHLFSPAFIYNQINGGQDKGSQINTALDLLVNQGVATLATMPYSDQDYRGQPSAAAVQEAQNFKGASWSVPRSLLDIKAALANKQPVIAGIFLYESFYNLRGQDAVYNSIQGNPLGGHAVAVVGYDDDKYGGALKIINSHGAEWGDNGYFWLPYAFMSAVPNGADLPPIFMQSYVLQDKDNAATPVTETKKHDTVPQPSGALPNLTVQDWWLNYDTKPNGLGSLTYSVANTGQGLAQQGATISLLLSVDAVFSANDRYIVYEPIPFDLQTGERVYRDNNNAIEFYLPNDLKNGDYYIALWADDRNIMVESDEKDNLSVSNSKVVIESNLPDLAVYNWYAEWDAFGDAALTYRVNNDGVSAVTATGWDVSLVLSRDQQLGNGDEILLFTEPSQFSLESGQYVYRDDSMAAPAAPFSVLADFYGNRIPAGNYYMALWVDRADQVAESNESNNTSLSTTTSLLGMRGDKKGRAYNGKTLSLPSKPLNMRKIRIAEQNGQRTVQLVGEVKPTDVKVYDKAISAGNKAVFPTVRSIAMP